MTFEIDINRCSRPQLIETANRFAEFIPERIEKEMGTFREAVGNEPEVLLCSAESEVAEAGWFAQLILDLIEQGIPFRDMAVLVRTSAAYLQLVKQFGVFEIPVRLGGTGKLRRLSPSSSSWSHSGSWIRWPTVARCSPSRSIPRPLRPTVECEVPPA